VPTLACKNLLITNGDRFDKSLSDSTGVTMMKRGKWLSLHYQLNVRELVDLCSLSWKKHAYCWSGMEHVRPVAHSCIATINRISVPQSVRSLGGKPATAVVH